MTIMLAHRLPTARIAALRPLRPPSTRRSKIVPTPRLFTHNSQLLLLASHTPRPQLPYLAQPAFSARTPPHQLIRLLSTENRRFFKEQVYLAAKWSIIGWTFIVLAGVTWFGYNIEVDERTNPTPREWRFRTRQALRAARAFSEPEDLGGITDWAKVGGTVRGCLGRLEDENHEGKGLQGVAQDGEGILIEGVGQTGYDISSKGWPWRAGYFEVLMRCAEAAEHLDGMILDKHRKLVFPKDVMIGPSNPDPRPVPPYMKAAPKEEDCVAPFEKPETYYFKVLTGKGFTTEQRLDAALAYANWLEFQGSNSAAYEMYRWGVDIAMSSLPSTMPSASVIDLESYTLKEGASDAITSNLLRATTSLAIHHARTGNISSALPILLSTLRARRTAPIAPSPHSPTTEQGFSLWNFLFVPPKFPDQPLGGDERLIRPSTEPTCAESELMLYVGEIIFAGAAQGKGGKVEEGLNWTKQAVTIADAQLAKLVKSGEVVAEEEGTKCKECFLTGVENWEVMVRRLLEEEEDGGKREGGRWKFWSRGPGSSAQLGGRREELESDRQRVDELRERIVREGLRKQVVKTSNMTGLWFGG